jgi:hypothetical protein
LYSEHTCARPSHPPLGFTPYLSRRASAPRRASPIHTVFTCFRGCAIFEQISPASVLPGARTSSRGLCAALAAFHTPVRLIRGVQRIAALQPELAALARRCGQAGEADHLLHFLSTPDALRKTPWLLLGCDGDASSFAAAAQTPAWAALLFEYRLPLPAGLAGARLYASADSTGRRNVLAPPGRRSAAAALAAHTLITHGAHIVHIAFSETYQDSPAATPHDPQVQPSTSSVDESLTEDAHRRCGEDAVELRIASALQACDRIADRSLSRRLRGQLAWTLHQHAIPLYLPLLDTLEATLATNWTEDACQPALLSASRRTGTSG